MISSYYRSEPDALWDRFKEQSNGHAEFFDDVRDYLLEEYSTNFTQFIEILSPPACDVEYWDRMAESGADARKVIDDVFQDQQQERQQRYIANVVLG